MSYTSLLSEKRSRFPNQETRPPAPIESDYSGRTTYLRAKMQWRYVPCLCPPATRQELALLKQAVAPFTLPAEIKLLYETANGDVDGALKPGNRFNTISAVIEMHSAYQQFDLEDL